jgi:phosphatidylglycerol:prolipoprotein diacylglycerol transferase
MRAADETVLDSLVRRAHGIRVFGHRYHPYHAALDLGTVALIGFSAWFTARHPGLSFVRFLAAFLIAQAVYWLVRMARQRWLGMTSRSLIQDSVLILLPTFGTASWLLGNDLAASLDLAGLDLALGAAFIRVGCFLGGCCYGRPVRWGVAYREEFLRPVRGCRTYAPGPVPGKRVLPIQLLDSAVQALSFGVLMCWLLNDPRAQGRVLAGYFLIYGCWRLVGDFWREASARPRRAGLSEAQWASLVVVAAAVTALLA